MNWETTDKIKLVYELQLWTTFTLRHSEALQQGTVIGHVRPCVCLSVCAVTAKKC